MTTSHRSIAAVFLAIALVVASCGDDDATSETTIAEASAGSAAGARAELVSANTATEEELQTIPGVGPEIAHEIMEYRPYDAETGPAKFREEMSKYLSDEDVEAVIVHLSFD